MLRRCLLICTMLMTFPAQALEEVYLAPERFVAETFGGSAPKPRLLWLTRDVATVAGRILGHAPSHLRQRYWADGNKSVWVLDEIGKEEPITAGFVIENGHITQARVLVFRESRGAEIHYPAFLKQYLGATLSVEKQLDRNIDGISGATLSVHAMGRMARLALYFDAVKQMEDK